MTSNRERWRRLASVGVLLLAGLTSLATSPGTPNIDDQLTGQSEVSGDGATVKATITVDDFTPNSHQGGGYFEFQLAGEPGGIVLTLSPDPSEATSPVDTSAGSLRIDLRLDGCSPRCTREMTVNMHLSDSRAAPAVVAWQMQALAYGEGRIALDAPSSVGSLVGTFTVAFAAGGAAGTVLTGFLFVLLRRRAAGVVAVLEATAAFILLIAGTITLLGTPMGFRSAVAGVAEAAAAVAVLVGAALRRTWFKRPTLWLAPVLIVLLPFAIAQLAASGAFRPIDVSLLSFALGVSAAVGVLELGLLLLPSLSRVDQRNGVVVVAEVLTALVVVTSIGTAATIALASFQTNANSIYFAAGPFVVVAIVIGLCFWRWINGDSLSAFVLGVVATVSCALMAVVAGAFGLLANSFGGSDNGFILPAIAGGTALASLAMTVLAISPPRLRHGTVVGRDFQTAWPGEAQELTRG